MERKLREINGSLVITIPKQICDFYNFKSGDKLSIEPNWCRRIEIKQN